MNLDLGVGFKELYEVQLKATYPIEIGQKLVEKGEVIAYFDKIQLANFSEIKNRASAKGGVGNSSLVFWEDTKEVQLNFVQGVFSKSQFALMNNLSLIHNSISESLLIDKREILETNEAGEAILNKKPVGKIFVYDLKNNNKLGTFDLQGNSIIIDKPFLNVVVDYQYEYSGSSVTLQVGRPLIEGFLSLTGKMKVKDDITGQVRTGIIKIPKLKLMSDLSMRLGKDAIPLVGKLSAVALPEGGKGSAKVMEIIFLDDDVDSDM